MVPFALKLFFGSYPASCRFLIYRARSLLLTPPHQPTGDTPGPANAFAFVGRPYGFGVTAAADACGCIGRPGWVRWPAKAAEVERVRIARLTRMLLFMLSSCELERCASLARNYLREISFQPQ